MGNTGGETRPGRSAGPGVSNGLDRVREVALKDKDARFTALLHHVSCLRLSLAFDALKKDAAPRRGRGDLAGVRQEPAGEPAGPARAGAVGEVPGGAVGARLHPEGGRAAAAARHRVAGGQDRPARRRGGAERGLRGGLQGLLLRVPAGKEPARCAGRPRGRARKAGGLGAGRGYPRLFRPSRPGMAGEVPPAPDRGREDPAAGHEMAERGSLGGRAVVRQRGGHATGRFTVPVACECIFALCPGPAGRSLEEDAGARECHCHAVRGRLHRRVPVPGRR